MDHSCAPYRCVWCGRRRIEIPSRRAPRTAALPVRRPPCFRILSCVVRDGARLFLVAARSWTRPRGLNEVRPKLPYRHNSSRADGICLLLHLFRRLQPRHRLEGALRSVNGERIHPQLAVAELCRIGLAEQPSLEFPAHRGQPSGRPFRRPDRTVGGARVRHLRYPLCVTTPRATRPPPSVSALGSASTTSIS